MTSITNLRPRTEVTEAPVEQGFTEPKTMVAFKNVSKAFVSKRRTVTALENVSLEIKQGDIYGIIGYSGAGKSTLLRTVNGLELPTDGQVIVDGNDIAALDTNQLSRLRQRIGMIFQHFNLLSSRTVFGNVAYPLRLAGVPKEEIAERVNELLEFVGLSDKAKAYPEQLSGGQKQRVGIARALANRPAVLISDEATSALDPQTTEEVLDLLKRVNAEYGVTVLLITHQMEVVKAICNKVAVMQDGAVIESGNLYDIFADPQHATTERFVSSVLQHHPGQQVLEKIADVHRGTLVEISVEDRLNSEPYLSKIAREFGIDFNVVFGGVNQLQSKLFGSLTLELIGDPVQVQAAIGQLRLYTQVREVSARG